MERITFPHLERVPGLRYALTTRRGGVSRGSYASLNLGYASGDDEQTVSENRCLAAEALGFPDVVTLDQRHGAQVVVVDAMPAATLRADAIVLRRPGLLAGVLGADCPLALLVDARTRALALVHSGWRGTVAGVVPRAIDVLRETVGSEPGCLEVALAPGMCAACYEVGPEVVSAVRAHVPGESSHLLPTQGGRARLDLHGAILAQLEAAGVEPSNVIAHPGCTYEDDATFYSYRRDGQRTGRHALLAGWV